MTNMTRHAENRCFRRGIPFEIVSLILARGDREVSCGGGCTALEIGSNRIPELRQLYGSAAERARNVILVVNEKWEIVTVLRANNRKSARRYRKGWN